MMKQLLSLAAILLMSSTVNATTVTYLGSLDVANSDGPYDCGVKVTHLNEGYAKLEAIVPGQYSSRGWLAGEGIAIRAEVDTDRSGDIDYNAEYWAKDNNGDGFMLDVSISANENSGSSFGHFGTANIHTEPGFFISSMTIQCWLFAKK